MLHLNGIYRLTCKPRAMLPGCLMLLMLASNSAVAAVVETIGPGDSVRVTVYQNPDLTTETRVSGQGTLVMPLVGSVDVNGLSATQAGEKIARELQAGRYLVDPQVTVTVMTVRSRQVSVLGHVAQPGQYALDGGSHTLTEVLASAGGITESGDDTVIVVSVQNGEAKKLEINVPRMYETGDLSKNIELLAGDTVFVPPAEVFYVYGEVQRAGSYRLRPKTSVLDALSLGGGLTPRGTDRGLRIHRKGADGTVSKFDAELSDLVMANDVIQVRESLF
jgi:polysaccharide export outer membrane protein